MEFMGRNYSVLIKRGLVKNARITIKSRSGEVVVSVPSFYEETQIQALLTRHRGWIEKQWRNIASVDNAILEALNTYPDKFLVFGEWQKIIEENRAIDVRYLKVLLLKYLHARVPEIASKMKLRYNKISVRLVKTRLGTCSANNNLSFSLLLICASKELIDYVIIHELSHVAHKNHSKNFWNLVESYCLDHRRMRKELHSQVKLYLALLERLEK